MAAKQKQHKERSKRRVVLVFGEDDNDREAVKHLVQAIWPEVPSIEPRRAPLILQKGRDAAEQRKNAAAVANVVRGSSVTVDVVAVLAHQDCDAVEPAHVALSEQIEMELGDAGVPLPCAATPAWEIESWWYLWPEAVAQVNPRWCKLAREGEEVGRIVNVKERLIKDLRPKAKDKRTADYVESDAPRIASTIRERNHVNDVRAKSASFMRFRKRVLEIRDALASEVA
ncbi:hypothetical protein [Trinickia acidisoli]|uniref:hypothetical protein n=1 Tax=Trinickia acidisoli TaxID=2767482 RepID=UPI001A8CA8A4|nr:hypothetical protein [Trinickia acidisoli]